MDSLKIRKWVGFHLNSHGEPDFHLVDHNPGYLAHTFQLEIEVPPEVAEHLARKLPCVLLDKLGKPVGECPSEENELLPTKGNKMSAYDWEHYHRAQEWVAKNHPEQEGEFPACWDEAWEATRLSAPKAST